MFCPRCGAEINTAARPNDEKYRPLSPWAYWGLAILYSIPVIGFIFMIVYSFNDSNINRRNFTRSFWCWLVIVIIILVIMLATGMLSYLAGEINL